jgi:hypothetical protein
MSKYIAPSFLSTNFHCPNCQVHAAQIWHKAVAQGRDYAEGFKLCWCSFCENYSIWHNQIMIYPDSSAASPAHDKMPSDVKEDFEEARSIVTKSPRGAAALLRLCLQKLMIHLKEKGKDINADIGNLVKKGLPAEIQQAWDSVRVVGNVSVHPGEMNLNDTPEIAHTLFDLVNIIVDVMIAQPKRISILYNSLPEHKLTGIEKRDANS